MSGAGRRGRKPQTDVGFEEYPEDEVARSGSFFRQAFLIDREQWYDAWSDELVTTYHILKDHCESQGLPFLETCSFHDFLDFAFKHSSKRPPSWN
jgi:hypothetical protein